MTPIQAAVAEVCTKTVNIHIDKIHIKAPCYHMPRGRPSYHGGDEFGLMQTSASASMKALKDDHEQAYIRSVDINGDTGMANFIEVECCPPLVLQKHNLFGHGNLQTYVYEILDLAAKRMEIEVSDDDRAEWRKGAVGLTEIHLTGNFACPSSCIVQIIDAIDANNLERKRRPKRTWLTLDNGVERNSTFYSLTIYGKHAELKGKAAFRKPGPTRKLLLAEACNAIRAEVKIHSEGLKHLDLGYVSRWKDVDVAALFFEIFNSYDVTYAIQPRLTEAEQACLTRPERNAYLLWLAGVDIEDQYARTNAWSMTKKIYDKTGIKVSSKRRPKPLPDLDLREVFAPANVLPVPAWAIGTPYYSGPRGYGISGVPIDFEALD